jgi:hypothetical protein
MPYASGSNQFHYYKSANLYQYSLLVHHNNMNNSYKHLIIYNLVVRIDNLWSHLIWHMLS